jgi:hypothetical protein
LTVLTENQTNGTDSFSTLILIDSSTKSSTGCFFSPFLEDVLLPIRKYNSFLCMLSIKETSVVITVNMNNFSTGTNARVLAPQ